MQQTAAKLLSPDAGKDLNKNNYSSYQEHTCSWTDSSVDSDITTDLEVALTAYRGSDAVQQAKTGAKIDSAKNKQRVPNLGDEAYSGKKTIVHPEAVVKVRTSNLIIKVSYAKYRLEAKETLPYEKLRETATKVAKKALLKSK